MKIIRSTIGAAALVAVFALTGCGSGSDASSPADSGSSPQGNSGRPGGFDQEQIEKIQTCLEAAGLEDAFPTDRPTDGMGEPPSGFDPDNPPSDLPSDLPSDFPSGGPGGGGGGGLGALQDPEVQEALEACGIELPSPGQGSDNSN